MLLASDVLDFAEKLRQDILQATGCTASRGIGSNILLAKLATRKAKPNGKYFVTKEEVQNFVGMILPLVSQKFFVLFGLIV